MLLSEKALGKLCYVYFELLLYATDTVQNQIIIFSLRATIKSALLFSVFCGTSIFVQVQNQLLAISYFRRVPLCMWPSTVSPRVSCVQDALRQLHSRSLSLPWPETFEILNLFACLKICYCFLSCPCRNARALKLVWATLFAKPDLCISQSRQSLGFA